MASQNAGALLTGMTDGVVNMWKFGLQQQRYDREDERQAKRDAREETESGIRNEAAQMTLEKARDERDTQRYLREGGELFLKGEDVPDFATWRASQSASSKPVASLASAAAAAPTAPAAPGAGLPVAELPPLKPAAPASTATSAATSGTPTASKPGSAVPNPFADTMPSVAPQAAPVTAPAATQQADKSTPSIGDVIAAKGVKQQRTEDDLIKWEINKLRSLRLHDKANELETKWLDVTEKRQAREKALLLEKTLAGINQIGGDYVAQNLAPLFGKDVELRHEPDGNGGGVITAYKASDPTKPIGTQRYKDESDLYDMTERYIDPTGYAKRVAEAKAAEVKHQRDLQVAAARSGAYYDVNGDVVGRVDGFTARGRGGNGGNGGGGGGDGTGTRGTKPPKTKADIASDMYMATIQAVGQNASLTADQYAAGNTAARSAMQLNPGIDPSIAADAGVRFAQADPGKTSIRWDAKTMTALEGVQTPSGWVAVNQVNHRNAQARGMPPEKIRAAVESSIQQLTGGDPAQRQKVIAAAFDKTGQARRVLLNQIQTKSKAELVNMPEFKKLPPQVQAQKLAGHERIVNDMLATPLGWIANFGQELNK